MTDPTAVMMYCPGCARQHPGNKEDECPDVLCECGLLLRRVVPIFKSPAWPAGWKWAGVCTTCRRTMTDEEVKYSNAMISLPTCNDCAGLED